MKKQSGLLSLFGLMAIISLLAIGCAGRSVSLGKSPTLKAQELYIQALDMETSASSGEEYQAAAAVYARAVRAGSPEAACALAEMYRDGMIPAAAKSGESEQEAVERAAFALYVQAARAGYVPAQYQTAVLYADARGTARDMAEARAWLLKAGENNHADALLQLGRGYAQYCGCGPDCDCGSTCSYGLVRDYAQAVYWLERAAGHSDSYTRGEAMSHLGNLYTKGMDHEPDYAQAAIWYQRAIAEGRVDAEDSLAFMYMRGQGVPRDYEQAVRMYEGIVNRHGESRYGYNLGVLYFYAPQGPDKARRNREAVRLFRDAADNDWEVAQSALGECYEYGVGVPRNYAEAAKWYGLAAEQGYADAQFLLGDLYRRGLGLKRDYAEARRLYEQAARQGSAWGKRGLGDLYYNGYGVEQDLPQAFEFYTSAADNNDQEAMFRAAEMLERGLGTPVDLETAVYLYKRVADFPFYAARYWDPDKVRQYRDKANAALQRLGY